MYEDRTLKCRECGGQFVFTAGEQTFYAERGFEHEPTRCPDCRQSRRPARRGARELSEIICAACGATSVVPFRPQASRPAYCRECYGARG